MKTQSTKSILDLTIQDLDTHPLWFDYVDDDELLVAIDWTINMLEGVYYLKASFIFADSATFSGYIRVTDGMVMALGIWGTGDQFHVYPLMKEVREPLHLDPSTFAALFARLSEQVFPIHYQAILDTPIIDGSIDAHTDDGVPIQMMKAT